jgi:hypothetical protein
LKGGYQISTYNVYTNNKLTGTIEILDAEEYIKENYQHKGLRYKINEIKNELHLYFDI